NTAIQHTLNLVKMRTDYVGTEISMSKKGPYIKAQFWLRNGALSNELIIHPIGSEGGEILRVCDLGVGRVPLGVDGNALCQYLNWKVNVGRFLCPSDSDRAIWYMAHQFLDDDTIPGHVVNRMIDEALRAG